MGTEQQNIQLKLAFMTQSRGEPPRAAMEGREVPVAKHDTERPVEARVHLMEEV